MTDLDPFKKLLASTQMNDAVAKFLGEEVRQRKSLAAALDMANPLRKAMDDINLATMRATALVPDSATRMFEQTRKRWLDAASLDVLTKPAAFDVKLQKAMASIHLNSILSEHAKLFERVGEGINKTALEAFERIDATMKGAFSAFDASLQERLAEAAKPLAGIMSAFDQHGLCFQPLLDGALKEAAWAEQFRWPSVDLKVAALVGKAWGPEGLESQLRKLGLDKASMQAMLQQVVAEGRRDDRQHAEEGENHVVKIRGISIWNWLALIGFILNIVVPAWQKMDGDTTEANRATAFAQSEKRNAERMDALMAMVQTLASQTKPRTTAALYVTKSRAAIVRKLGRSGATKVAVVFPNQIVELVSENGKWIKVEYFDWLAQEERTGWVLRKYFARVRSVMTEPSD